MFYRIIKYCLIIGSLISNFVYAQNEQINLYSVNPYNLLTQRLHVATLPREAELRCNYEYGCYLGLSRGLALGTNLVKEVATPLFYNLYRPGAWFYADATINTQVLTGVDDLHFSNIGIGFSYLSYIDSDKIQAAYKSVYAFLHYAAIVNPAFTLGFNLKGDFYKKFLHNKSQAIFDKDDKNALKAFNTLFYFATTNPMFKFSLLGDFELLNWQASNIDLPNDLRLYISEEPYFIYDKLLIDDLLDRNYAGYGLRSLLTLVYEHSSAIKSGNFSTKLSTGFNLLYTTENLIKPINTENNLLIPYAKWINFEIDLTLMYQF